MGDYERFAEGGEGLDEGELGGWPGDGFAVFVFGGDGHVGSAEVEDYVGFGGGGEGGGGPGVGDGEVLGDGARGGEDGEVELAGGVLGGVEVGGDAAVGAEHLAAGGGPVAD